MPERIQMSRQHPWRKDHPDAVIVARPSKWGNIFKIGSTGWRPVDDSGVWSKEPHPPMTRQDAVDAHRWSTLNKLRDDPHYLDDLRGRDVACWCGLDDPCHGDTYLELANGTPTSPIP